MDNALIDLYRHSLVDAQTAIDAAHDVDYVTKNTGPFLERLNRGSIQIRRHLVLRPTDDRRGGSL